MASLTRVLRTDVMADLDMKAMAQLLRSKGRGRDTVLAHITPREAKMLKEQGGSGTINPETGLPEFQEMDFGMYAEAPAQAFEPESTYDAYATPLYSEGSFGQEVVPGGPGGGAQQLPELQLLSAQQPTPGPTAFAPPSVRAPEAQLRATTPEGLFALLPERPTPETTGPVEQPGYFSRLGTSLQRSLEDPATLARLGLGLGGAGLGLLTQQRGAQQAQRARSEQAAIGAPYRAQGQELIEQARRGELSPASMQAYQAMQAQVAQATARQGGIGATQGAAALERMRAQLLENQYRLGLNVANIGDQYMRGAIATGMSANQALNQASNTFFTNLAATLSGPTVQTLSAARQGGA
jgi:hypothetical protein